MGDTSASSQAYFWQFDWQLDEEQAERERDSGQGMVFDDPEDAIRWLMEGDNGDSA